MNDKYEQLELAQILGEPKDPRKPYPAVVEAVCETVSADVKDYTYYYDVLVETDKIITMNSGAAITTENVSPDSPALFTFQDIGTPEYWIKVQDLATAKEDTLARKNKTIDRALNAREIHYLISLLSTAASSVSHTNLISSGMSRFGYVDLIYMIEDVIDYADSYKLIVGSTIDQDIKLWNWNDNKYTDLMTAFNSLGITKFRVNGSVTIDGSATDLLSSIKAYLVATDTEIGKPGLFVRKKLSDIDFFGSSIMKSGDKPERIVFFGHNPVAVSVSGTPTRYLGISATGYENVVAAILNPYAISSYTRA